MGVVDFNLRKIGSEGHGLDFELCLENGVTAAAVAFVAAMVGDQKERKMVGAFFSYLG
ncbi:hypothetical protein HanIR_Chr06g0293111 [Helianthus annuus]|nr:hypothetical protein HanIR_Chr06g0293111 [Helianthus annuus]